MSRGIATIYQELDLVSGLSVADNIFLGREHARFGISRPAQANRTAVELLTRLGHPEIRPTAEVITLMTGRDIEYVFPPRPATPAGEQEPVLEVEELALAGHFSGVSFS